MPLHFGKVDLFMLGTGTQILMKMSNNLLSETATKYSPILFINLGEYIIVFNACHALILCALETPNWVLLQTVKTQMKCCIMQHFIRVCTV